MTAPRLYSRGNRLDCDLGGVYRGARGRAVMRAQEVNAGVLAAAWPWGSDGQIGVIGRDLFDISKGIVLTAVAGTPAAVLDAPASLSSSHAIISPDFDISDAFGPILRETPLEFTLLSYPLNDSPGGPQLLYVKT